MRNMRQRITDLAEIAGLGCLTIGAAGWHSWAGWIVGGVSMIYASASLAARGVRPPTEAEVRAVVLRDALIARGGGEDIAA